MALGTITITGAARLGAALGTLNSSGIILINSGSCGVMPHAASGFTCLYLSCLGNKGVGNGKGFIGAPFNSGEQSGIIHQVDTRPHDITLGMINLERTVGSTVVAEGGGSQLPVGASGHT